MRHPHQQPGLLFTSYLAFISGVYFPEEEVVQLYGIYGNMISGEFENCTVQISREMVDRITADTELDTNYPQIFEAAYNTPGEEIDLVIDKNEGMTFEEHFFALCAVVEENEEGELDVLGDDEYIMQGFIPLDNVLPTFFEEPLPAEAEKKEAYLQKLIAARYPLYEELRRNMGMKKALVFSGLSDSVVYWLARAAWEKRVDSKQ